MGQRVGPLEEANGGTLFLDEACSLPVSVQAKLLRAIELREFRRVGGHQRLKSRFRLVTAAAQPMEELVASGRWREDFAYRVGGVTITIPPLRGRGDDIWTLAIAFLNSAEAGRCRFELGEGALALLRQYSWPGNVRELRTLMERLAALTDGPTVVAQDILAHLPKLSLEFDERTRLETVLDAHQWDITRTARALGMSRGHLYRRLRLHNLSRKTLHPLLERPSPSQEAPMPT